MEKTEVPLTSTPNDNVHKEKMTMFTKKKSRTDQTI